MTLEAAGEPAGRLPGGGRAADRLALSSGPDKPRLAFFDQIPDSQTIIRIGSERIDFASYTDKLFDAVEKVPVDSRAQALEKVRSGDALAALIIPPDFTRKLSNSGFSSASVEVVYNGDALRQSFVRSTVNSNLALAAAALVRQVRQVAGGYIDLIATGGTLNVLGTSFDLLGLNRSKALLDEVLLKTTSEEIAGNVAPVQQFTALGVANFTRFKDLLNTVERPVVATRPCSAGAARRLTPSRSPWR
ncbi:MAG: hypothetical protein ACR2LK_07905 [Solirubrobacteraceae bacterium]